MRLIGLMFCFLVSMPALAQERPAPITLTPDAENDEIFRHLYQHEMNQTQTDALAVNFPDLGS